MQHRPCLLPVPLACRVGHAEQVFTVVAPRHPEAARTAVASGFGYSDKFKATLSLPKRSSESHA